jgi:hypothetical protein
VRVSGAARVARARLDESGGPAADDGRVDVRPGEIATMRLHTSS